MSRFQLVVLIALSAIARPVLATEQPPTAKSSIAPPGLGARLGYRPRAPKAHKFSPLVKIAKPTSTDGSAPAVAKSDAHETGHSSVAAARSYDELAAAHPDIKVPHRDVTAAVASMQKAYDRAVTKELVRAKAELAKNRKRGTAYLITLEEKHSFTPPADAVVWTEKMLSRPQDVPGAVLAKSVHIIDGPTPMDTTGGLDKSRIQILQGLLGRKILLARMPSHVRWSLNEDRHTDAEVANPVSDGSTFADHIRAQNYVVISKVLTERGLAAAEKLGNEAAYYSTVLSGEPAQIQKTIHEKLTAIVDGSVTRAQQRAHVVGLDKPAIIIAKDANLDLPPNPRHAVWTHEKLNKPQYEDREFLERPVHLIDSRDFDDRSLPAVKAKLRRMAKLLPGRVILFGQRYSHRADDELNGMFFERLPVDTLEREGLGIPPAHSVAGAAVKIAAERAAEAEQRAKRAHAPAGEGGNAVPMDKVFKAKLHYGLETASEVEFHPIPTKGVVVEGFPELDELVDKQVSATKPGAAEASVSLPKGVLLIGPSGTGKSASVKKIAQRLGRPLYMIGDGEFGGAVHSEAERNIKALLDTFRGQRVVLWIDELDKLIAMGDHDFNQDYPKKILKALLSFMDENKDIYFAFTVNSVNGIPPETFRNGRVDATIFLDLPERVARIKILNAHLNALGWTAAPKDIEAVAAATDYYSGGELQDVVKAAFATAWHQGRPATGADLLAEAAKIVPSAIKNKAAVDRLREWAAQINVTRGAAEAGDPRLPRAGLVEVVKSNLDIKNLGGFGAFKTWMEKQSAALLPRARKMGIPLPKGFMMVGIPGAGKSHAAKIAASMLKRPLLKLSFSKLLEKENPTAALAEAIREIEAAGECVVQLDEYDKMLTSAEGSFGLRAPMLEFMDRQTKAFWVATANDLSKVSPEYLRDGRFDAKFWVDLPTEKERISILKGISMEFKPTSFRLYEGDLPRLAKASAGFSPVELRQRIIEAQKTANLQKRIATVDDVEAEMKAHTPDSIRQKDTLDLMRSNAMKFGVPVSDEVGP